MGAMTQLTVTASVMLRQAVSCRRAVQIMIDDGGRMDKKIEKIQSVIGKKLTRAAADQVIDI
jgi:hypothetical protein